MARRWIARFVCHRASFVNSPTYLGLCFPRVLTALHRFAGISILLEPHQFLQDDIIHGIVRVLRLTPVDENCPSKKVHGFPLQLDEFTVSQARVKGNRNDGADVISATSEMRKQFFSSVMNRSGIGLSFSRRTRLQCFLNRLIISGFKPCREIRST